MQLASGTIPLAELAQLWMWWKGVESDVLSVATLTVRRSEAPLQAVMRSSQGSTQKERIHARNERDRSGGS